MLFLLLIYGYYEDRHYIEDDELSVKYLKIGYEAGDCISTLLYASFCDPINQDLIEHTLPQVQELADSGDIYAEFILGLLNEEAPDGERDSLSAAEHFLNAYPSGFYLAANAIFEYYYNGDAPFKKDWVQGSLWAKEVLKFGNPADVFNVACMFMNIEEYGCEDDDKKQAFYKKAIELWKELTDLGHCTAPTNLGWMYSVGRGTPVDLKKAAQYYSIAAERGDDVGQCNLGYDYLNGRGVSCNRKEAKYWLEKSAEQGNQRAKDLLRENFS